MGNPYEVLKKYEGKYIKYAELCRLIEEPAKRGNGKTAHINRLKEHVDLAERKGKIYIGRVYDSSDELQIIDNRNRFNAYIKQFLINLFYHIGKTSEANSVVLTNRDILEMTCMVNKNYFVGKRAPYKFLDYFDVNMNEDDAPSSQYLVGRVMDETSIFFHGSYRLLKRVVYNALKQLERSHLIVLNKTFRLYKNTKDKFGKNHSEYHDCNEEEVRKVLEIQYESLTEFNDESIEIYGDDAKYQLDTTEHIHFLPRIDRERFYKIFNRKIEEGFKEGGWNACSVAWKIIFTTNKVLDYEVRKVNYNQLNENVQNKLMTAKDLNLIETSLKQQFVDTFIKTT